MRREVFRLLEVVIPEASTTIPPLIRAVRDGPTQKESINPEIDCQLVIDLLAQMSEAPEALDALEEYLREHPGPGPSEHLGYDRWISHAGFITTSPISMEDFLKTRSVEELVGVVADTLSNPETAPWSFRLPYAIASSAAESPSWARRMLDGLMASGKWDSLLWDQLLAGLSRQDVELEDAYVSSLCFLLLDVLGLVPENIATLGPRLRPISELLLRLTDRPKISIELIDQIEAVGASVAALIQFGPVIDIESSPEDIYARAYDHWTGWIARFWQSITSHRWQMTEASWSGLPVRTRESLQSLLEAPDALSVYPESILAGGYDFFAAADEAWTLEWVRPLFTFKLGEDAPARAWSSFCDGVKINERVLGHLRSDFRDAAANLRETVGENFAARFAEVMVRSASDYLSDGTLLDVIAAFDEAMRLKFTETVGYWLEHRSTSTFAEDQWPRWIDRYITDRIHAVPLALAGHEAGAMFPWVITAGKNFPSAVDKYVRTDPTFAESYGTWTELKGRGVAKIYPDSAIDLIDFVLVHSDPNTFYSCEDLGGLIDQLIEGLKAEGVEKLLTICELAAQVHCADAGLWRERVRQREVELSE